ncbi:MAG: KOW domain-containing RNA-binding protein [Candidatus Faecousia sp.]|nr:KOW domain-containing RNA-binding protein [Clostridiales bacterium]MDD7651832.1 KOW domain-containing RNA-binding protein [Bacillota bacterium]MDY4220617.1 KOW domain-containing RNA-binding protein [Candidatus Faecousia sp.]
MEIGKSDIVRSIAGRDQGKLFYVIETDGAYVLVANGKERRLERPKRKKLKHVRKVPRAESRVAAKILSGEKVLNSELRRDLAAFSQEIDSQ